MRRMEREMEWQNNNTGEYIWLRQSVTFTVGDQTRTMEIAAPVRLGASEAEIEVALREASAGMERLTRHLDAQVAALHADTPTAHPARSASATPPADVVAPASAAPAKMTSPTVAPTPPAPAPRPPVAPATNAPATNAPAAQLPTSAPTRSTQPPAAATPATPPTRATASGPLAPPTQRAQPASAPAAASVGADLTRAEFIAALGELHLSVNQAMERLDIRSLQGIHYRESLEALRRQITRAGAADPATPASQAVSQTPPTARARGASGPLAATGQTRAPGAPPPPAARFFEEEEPDEPDLRFAYDAPDGDAADDLDLDDAEASPAPFDHSAPLDDLADDLDLDDVPDFGPPPTPLRPPVTPVTPATSAAQRRTPPKVHAADALGAMPQASAPAGPRAALSPEDRSRAIQLIGQLRVAPGGGAPTSQQRMAYRNIIVRELGEEATLTLVQGIWRTTPEKMSTDQLDALVGWGKRETFGEEAALILNAMRSANTTRPAGAEPTSAQRPPTRPAPTTPTTTRSSATGTRSPGRAPDVGSARDEQEPE